MKIMSNREYWIWTEVFVHLHSGKDSCNNLLCPDCKWMVTVFGKEALRPKQRKVLPSHKTGKLSRKQVREAVRNVKNSGE